MAALDRARDALQSLSVLASRVAAFDVLSGAERTAERIPWLRARAAALRERERTVGAPAAATEAWSRARQELADAASALLAVAEGADLHADGVDEAAAESPRQRLRALMEALDGVEERLARFEAAGGGSTTGAR